MILSTSRNLRFLVLSALYFAQGVPWGFVAVGYVVMLTDLGVGDAAIGAALGAAYVPWSFKWLAGPVVDALPVTRLGRRRPVIALAELGMAISLLALLAIDPTRDLFATSAILFVHNACAALQDVAVDAMAIDLVPEDERGRANSLMWAAKSGGTVVGGSAGTLLAKVAGWPAVFWMLAAIVAAVLVLVLAVRETDGTPARAEARPPDLRALRRAFGHLRPWLALAVGLVSPVGYALLSAPFTIFLREDLHWTEERIALQAGLEPWAAVAGALAGGLLADRIGVRRTMGGAMAAIGVLLGGYALVPGWWDSFPVTLGFSLLQSLLVAVYSAASLTFFMAFCDPAVGATQFALYMASTNYTYAWTGPAGGWLSERGGAPLVLAVAAVAQLAAIPALLLVDPAARPEEA